MKKILQLTKRILGNKLTKQVRPIGHGVKSKLAAFRFGNPSKSLKIIAITGTKGKTTTTVFTGRLMNLVGIKTGFISTAVLCVDGVKEIINPYKMTSIDGFYLQKYLREMVHNGCEYVVLEMSSQGLEQNRHWGLNPFDTGVFLNLYPEHLEAHGGMDNYLACKTKLFEHLKPSGKVVLVGDPDQQEFVKKIVQILPATVKKTYLAQERDYRFLNHSSLLKKILKFGNLTIPTNQIADFELKNLAFAIEITNSIKPILNADLAGVVSQMRSTVPGRMELAVDNLEKNISEHTYHLSILVDYAHEPESLRQLMKTLDGWRKDGQFTHLMHVISSDGAGRDDWKKPVMGEISFKVVDKLIITTDNFDAGDNPADIVRLLGENIPDGSPNVFSDLRRRDAFTRALGLAQQIAVGCDGAKILIVSTNVGSEEGLTQPEGLIEWDEVEIWKEMTTR